MDSNDNLHLREKLEAMIVTTIQNDLQRKEITGDRAKEIAKIILDMVPEDITHEQLMEVIPQIDDKVSELAGVVHEILLEHDDKMKASVLPKLREMIAQSVQR